MSTSTPRFPLHRLLPPLIIVVLATLSGCGLFASRVVTLCTDRPEMAAYIELFNALGPDLQVVLSYQSDPAGTVAARNAKADVVIGTGLTGAAAKRQLEPLDRLFGEAGLVREDFYPGLLEAGLYDRKQVALPLSFRLPAVVFLRSTLGQEAPTLAVSLGYLGDVSAGFLESVRESYVRMGFSPLWDDQFLYQALSLEGSGFREDGEGGVQWKPDKLSSAVSVLNSWINQADGGSAKSAEFGRKYLYQPMAKLVDERRILFHLSDSSRLMKDLEALAEEADFRWLSGEAGILVDESVLSIGIPKAAANKWGARIFVDWLLDAATQKRLLEVNQSKRLSTFGLSGGFSSLQRVTERDFPQLYPLFIGRIPPAELLDFPPPLPVNWDALKAGAVVPWAREFLRAGTSPEQASQALRAWIRDYRAERPSKL